MSRSTATPLPVFNKIILNKRTLAKHVAAVCNMSERTAYRLISGDRKFINSFEYDCVMSMVAARIDQLQQAV